MEDFAAEEAEKIVDLAIEEAVRLLDEMTKEERSKISVEDFVLKIAKIKGKDYKENLLKVVDEHFQGDKEQIREFLPNIESFGYSNTKVENELSNPNTKLAKVIKTGGFRADVASQKDKKKGFTHPVKAEFSLLNDTIIPDNFNYSSSVRLLVSAIGNAYDYAELETRAAGVRSVRVDHLINIMDGKPTTTRVRAERVQEVTEQIKILRTISVEIDAKDHQKYNAENKRGQQLEQNKFTGYLLPVEIIERKEFSKDKQIYINILKRPVLYEYAREAKQVITVKSEMLDLTTYPEGKTPTVDRIKYMTQQINSIRDLMLLETSGRGRNLPYTAITYEHIYKHVEDDIGKTLRKQTIHKNVDKVATALIAKGKIKKKEILPKGKKRYGTIRLYK